MDKHEYRTKTEQMLQYMSEKSYKQAADIADGIDWRRVKNVSMLCAVSEIYEYNKEFEKSRDVLFLAYERAPESRKIVYRLSTLALKMNEIQEAEDCFEEFLKLAPKDPNQYILAYKILKCKKAPLEEQIAVLKKFKEFEYVEKWAYELAVLYQKAGMTEECLTECDDMVLWFNEGKYVFKAMDLKKNYRPLTPLQQEKYNSLQKATEDNRIMPTLSIEEMLKDWEEKQKENAQLIQQEFQKAELEKEKDEAAKTAEAEEDSQNALPDDIRKLMEELETEAADIAQQKVNPEILEAVQESKPIAEKVQIVEPVVEAKKEVVAEEVEPEVTAVTDDELQKPLLHSFEAPVMEPSVVEEAPGIKLGDTNSMAAVAKALNSNAVVVEDEPVVTEEPVREVVQERPKRPSGYDTGFIVQGRYDLEAQSEVGIKAGLTEEQKELFSYFVPIHGMSEQLVEVLQSDKKRKDRYGTSRIGNLLIIGRKGSGKTVLAVDVVKAIQKARKVKQGKVGIVTADSLNKKDVTDILSKLYGGAIIIEKASLLSRRTVEDMCDVMEGQTGELLVVLEDERKPLERMLDQYPQFKKKFTSKLELPVFINDELVTFGQTYAKENGYKIDEMGILALYSRIDMLQRDEYIVTVTDVKEILDEAIDNAQRASFKKVMKKLLGKNRDESERVLLREEDFK